MDKVAFTVLEQMIKEGIYVDRSTCKMIYYISIYQSDV